MSWFKHVWRLNDRIDRGRTEMETIEGKKNRIIWENLD